MVGCDISIGNIIGGTVRVLKLRKTNWTKDKEDTFSRFVVFGCCSLLSAYRTTLVRFVWASVQRAHFAGELYSFERLSYRQRIYSAKFERIIWFVGIWKSLVVVNIIISIICLSLKTWVYPHILKDIVYYVFFNKLSLCLNWRMHKSNMWPVGSKWNMYKS